MPLLKKLARKEQPQNRKLKLNTLVILKTVNLMMDGNDKLATIIDNIVPQRTSSS